jgi:hypothetical protein
MCPQPRAQKIGSTRAIHHGSHREYPAFPARRVDGLFHALLGDRALLPPSPARSLTSLTPASGRQDHMALPYVPGAFVSCTATSTASRSLRL